MATSSAAPTGSTGNVNMQDAPRAEHFDQPAAEQEDQDRADRQAEEREPERGLVDTQIVLDRGDARIEPARGNAHG